MSPRAKHLLHYKVDIVLRLPLLKVAPVSPTKFSTVVHIFQHLHKFANEEQISIFDHLKRKV